MVTSDQLALREPLDGVGPTRRRRACVVVHSHYPSDPRVRREAESLLSDGWDLDIVCLESQGNPSREQADRATIHRLPGNRRWGSGPLIYLLEYVWFFFLALAYVSRLSLRHRYDVVHVHNVPDFLVFSAIVAKIRGARVILDIRDPMPDLYLSKFGGDAGHPVVRLVRWEEAVSCAFADVVLSPGEPSRRRLIGRKVPADKIVNVLNSADPALFPECLRQRPQLRRDDSFTLVYHGGLFERYGLDIAIHAVQQLRHQIPNLQLHIAGYGETTDSLKQMVRILNLEKHVTFAGWVAPEKIADFITSADLGVVPYRHDTFTDLIYPTKAFECIAVGVPVIMSALAGVVELFPDIPDVFFRPDDVDDLAKLILQLYEDRSRLSQLNHALQQAYVPYGWEGQRGEFLALVDRLARRN